MCSDCVDDAGDTPREDEDEEAVSAIAEVPAAIDDPWDRATDGERFPWRLWSIRDTTWVTLEPAESVLFHDFLGLLFSQGHNKYFLLSRSGVPNFPSRIIITTFTSWRKLQHFRITD